MAMENTLFIGDFPIETAISSGFPIAMFDSTPVLLVSKNPPTFPNALEASPVQWSREAQLHLRQQLVVVQWPPAILLVV